jgi:GNAT superfamily N-acetyltransferase
MTPSEGDRSTPGTAADVEIRPVRPEDLEDLVDIYLAGARHHVEIDPEGFRMPERADVAVRLRRRIDNQGDDSAYVAAIVDGRMVGSATMDRLATPHPGAMAVPIPTAELGIAMLEGWRGLGIGRRLIEHREGWAAARGIERISLTVSYPNDRAIRLYRDLGYRESGYEMRKDLGRHARADRGAPLTD